MKYFFFGLFQVYDKDRASSDDFMGFADLDLTAFEVNESQEVTLHIEDGGDEKLLRSEDKIKYL